MMVDSVLRRNLRGLKMTVPKTVGNRIDSIQYQKATSMKTTNT